MLALYSAEVSGILLLMAITTSGKPAQKRRGFPSILPGLNRSPYRQWQVPKNFEKDGPISWPKNSMKRIRHAFWFSKISMFEKWGVKKPQRRIGEEMHYVNFLDVVNICSNWQRSHLSIRHQSQSQ